MAVLFMSVDMSISDYAPVVWRDYDWEKGIEKDEEFNKAVFLDGLQSFMSQIFILIITFIIFIKENIFTYMQHHKTT